jgi:hypothetical protein
LPVGKRKKESPDDHRPVAPRRKFCIQYIPKIPEMTSMTDEGRGLMGQLSDASAHIHQAVQNLERTFQTMNRGTASVVVTG